VQAALDELKTALRGQFGERLPRVVLFGSYARGTAHTESDVDVSVVVSPGSGATDIERSTRPST
jgi:uncharacterized protein